jgi:hypothetical protein
MTRRRIARRGLTSPRLATAAALFLTAVLATLPAGVIRLNGGEIDTSIQPPLSAVPSPTAAVSSSLVTQDTRSLILVQFDGPIQPEWIEACEQRGAVPFHYVPDDAYMMLVPSGNAPSLLAASRVGWVGVLPNALKIQPRVSARLASGETTVDIIILSVDATPAVWLQQQGLGAAPTRMTPMGWQETRASVPGSVVPSIAGLWGVFHIELQPEIRRWGERAAQTAAGNYAPGASAPTGPGYAAWLAAHGLTGGAGLIVQVQDDGLDRGIATNQPGTAHPDIVGRIAGIFNATPDPLGDSQDGHGQINAGIIMGNAAAGLRDPSGYLLGQGLAPMARVYATKVFRNLAGPFDIGLHTLEDLAADAQNHGALFSNNSWGADDEGLYSDLSAEFDALTRDADLTEPGNQPMIYFVAAGNAGPGSGTIGSPATAKNVIAVGAGENSDHDGEDGCHLDPTGADDIRSLIDFSSRGPCADGRFGITVFAVGTHVQGPASTSPFYNGFGVCDQYWPFGQTLYARSSGTSHSTPATCGAGMIAYEFFQTHLAPRGHTANPSPALIRAVLANTATDMAGGSDGNGGFLNPVPNTQQGWGSVNLSALVENEAALFSFDQQRLFTGSGQSSEETLYPYDPGKPMKITLAWTDQYAAPNAGIALVNDLDLEVTDGANTYLGNVFAGGHSVTGGMADRRNTLESVYIANPGPDCLVRVIAHNIAGNGVPGNGVFLDQDFALFAWNATTLPGTGRILIDKPVVGGSDTIQVEVGDADLRNAGSLNLPITSTTGDAETLTLTETNPGSGIFRGTVSTGVGAPSPDGVIQVANGSVITATYHDARDDSGQPATVMATATADLQPPAILNLAVTDVGADRFTVGFNTDEPAVATLRAGLTAGGSTFTASGPRGTVHSLAVTGLGQCTTYLFRVEAQDDFGNLGVENNGGLFHRATTLPTVFVDDFEPDAEPGWTHAAVLGLDRWAVRTSTFARSATHVFSYTPGATSIADASLVTPPFPAGGELTFWHTYEIEHYVTGNVGFDGAVIEISTDGGTTWTDLGPFITEGGYNSVISSLYGSPIAGRQAWSGGALGAMTPVRADLSSFSGTAQVRFRYAADSSEAKTGWFIDDIAVLASEPCPNALPDAQDDRVVTNETSVTTDVRVNDHDDDGDALSVTGVTGPAHGTAVINPDGTITYTRTSPGVDRFVYTLRDSQGGADTARVTIVPDNAEEVLNYLLGVSPSSAGLDNNTDGVVDVSDLVSLMP